MSVPVSAASVVGEAMTAIVMAQAVLDKFGGDAMCDLLTNMENYKSESRGNSMKNVVLIGFMGTGKSSCG